MATVEEAAESEALTAIAAVSLSPSKVKAQPKCKRPLPELNPEMRMAAALGWARNSALARAGRE